jgi:hypothetical protein
MGDSQPECKNELLDGLPALDREHLLEIINGILDLSKIEAGKVQVERIACAPGAVLADVVSLMRVRADAKGLALKLEYAGRCPETILSNPTRLRQILINLVGIGHFDHEATDFSGVRVRPRLRRCTPDVRMMVQIPSNGWH